MYVLESTSTTFAFPLYQVEIHKSSLLPNTYMNIHITVCTRTDTDGYTHPHLHTHGHVYTDTHRCTHTQMPAYTYTDTCKYICVHARAHTHICQRAEMTGLERKAGVEERGKKSQRRPPQCLTSLSGFAFDFQLLIFISYYIKAMLPQVPRTQAASSSPDSKFLFPLGPRCQWRFTSH